MDGRTPLRQCAGYAVHKPGTLRTAMARPLCTARVVGRGLWGASSARALVGEYLYSVRVRVVNKQGFCRGSSVELVIRRDEGQPGEALGLPGGVYREDGRELYGIIPTEG